MDILECMILQDYNQTGSHTLPSSQHGASFQADPSRAASDLIPESARAGVTVSVPGRECVPVWHCQQMNVTPAPALPNLAL